MEIAVAIIITLSLIGLYIPVADNPQGETAFSIGGHMGAVKIRQDLTPISVIAQANIVHQEYDYSCGSAALSTLMRYYLGEELSEEEIIRGLVAYGDADQIEKRRAFSLLDMKRFVEVLGYKGSGFKAEIDDLRSLGRPCIVPIDLYEYVHFVVFKGIYGDHIFFADPAIGNISFTLEQFSQIWHDKIIFVVYPQDEGLVFKGLTLKESDLRIIDTYTLKAMKEGGKNTPLYLEQQNILQATGDFGYYHEKGK